VDDDTEVTGGSALGRVLRRSLNMRRGRTEHRRLRGGEGWSRRAKSVLSSYNALLEAYDRLATKIDGADEDLRRDFKDLTKRIRELEDKEVDNNKKDREQHKREIDVLTIEVETMELMIQAAEEEQDDKVGGPPPPPPLPPPPIIDIEPETPIPEVRGPKLTSRQIDNMLKDTEQALHRAGANFGGLGFCIEHIDDFGKDQQKDIKTLRAYNNKRIELLNKARQGELTEKEIATLSNQIRGLNEGFGKSVTDAVETKQEKSIDAVRKCGFGEDAEDLIGQLSIDSRTIKITDSPNPYWAATPPKPPQNKSDWDEKQWKAYQRMKDAWDEAVDTWEKSGMKGEVKEQFNPANRYVHIDGDEKVNAAKTAAAKVARALMPEIDMEKLKEEIKRTEGDKQRETVKSTKKDSIEENVIIEHMMEWYKTKGADMMEEGDEVELAKSWRGGDVLASDNQKLADKITEAANTELEAFKKDHLADALDEAIEKEVDSIVLMKANAKRARMMEAQTMTQGDYWVELGRMAKSADFGRCFSCAGVAVQALVMNSAFDNRTIESVGAVSYDHHFVLVGREGGEVGSTEPPAIDSKVLVVDIWQANQGGDPPANTWATFQYNSETELKVFCVMKPGKERKELRQRCLEYAKQE
jgi:hypothetical protein